MESAEPIYSIAQVARILGVRESLALELFEGEVGVLPVDISHGFITSKRRAAVYRPRIPSSVLQRVHTEKHDLVMAGAKALRDPAAPLRAYAEQRRRDRAALEALSAGDLPIEGDNGERFYSFVQIARILEINISLAVWKFQDAPGVLPPVKKSSRLYEPRIPAAVFATWQRARHAPVSKLQDDSARGRWSRRARGSR